MRKVKVWTLGDAVVDLLPELFGKLLPCPGGALPMSLLVWPDWEESSGFIGRVGDDPFGRFMYKTMTNEGVDVTYMHTDSEHRTSTVIVDLTSDGEENIHFYGSSLSRSFPYPGDLPVFLKETGCIPVLLPLVLNLAVAPLFRQ